jgi:23S rRNA pseudouridine1911/1915/1917 synthase
VLVNELQVRAAFRLKEGNRIQVRLPDLPAEGPEPEDIPLEILYEDEHLAAINKPPHMVVHPARGNWKGTLTAALAHHFQQLSDAGGPARPGVVHRLDRETSGVIVIAKTNRAHFELSSQFESRVTEKEYRAIVCGHPDRDRDLLDLPIGIHPYQREKMAIRADHSTSREAQTFYEVLERFSGFAFMRLVPRTGRTHQLRVHLAHIHLPVLCDRQYGGRCEIRQGELRGDRDDTLLLSRQALHAYSLRIQHPITRLPLEFVAPLPDDMQRVLDELRQFRSTVGR